MLLLISFSVFVVVANLVDDVVDLFIVIVVVVFRQEFTGKLPPEYIRYLDLNEKVPKAKKRFGAEYKVKPRGIGVSLCCC